MRDDSLVVWVGLDEAGAKLFWQPREARLVLAFCGPFGKG